MPRINPENLRWARETAGLSLEEAAHGIGLTGASAIDRLAQMESGAREPTRRQLVAMAKRYRRPLLALYLEAPPANGERAPDFRTLRERDVGQEAALEALVRDTRVRQALLRGALEDEEEAEPLPLVGSVTIAQGAAAVADIMERTLQFRIADYRAARTVDDAFAILRQAVERSGVFVLLIGNLGNYRSNISPRVFRGFCIANSVAPFIVINETDSRAAWSFTLLHELAHVFLGQSAISGYGSENALERFCDDAASAFLLRPGEIDAFAFDAALPFDTMADQIRDFASGLKVSRKMVAYNLLRAGRISNALYRRLDERFDADRLAAARQQGGGADYYIVRRHRIGRGLIRTVQRMVNSGALTTSKAGRVLGVKPTAVDRLTAGINTA